MATHGFVAKSNKKSLSPYEGESGRKYHQQVNSVSEQAFNWVARLRKEKLQKYIKKEDVVLEYGVGTGWNLASVECKKKIGFDVAHHLKNDLARLGIEFVPDVALIPSRSVDVVICHHVLEHVSEPLVVLDRISNLLKPRGKLLLFVPAEPPARFSRYVPNDQNHHLFSWTCQSIGNLVTCSNFAVKICEMQTFGYDKLASTVVSRLHFGESGFRIMRRLCHMVRHDKEIFLLAEVQ